MIRIQRLYIDEREGFRVLVDRLWPRGMSKEKLFTDLWMKEVAPTDELRKWFAHEPERWEEFKKRYLMELNTPEAKEKLNEIKSLEKKNGTVTLLYGAKDEDHNQAVVLKQVLDSM
jgi:Uncharacterized conserved protein